LIFNDLDHVPGRQNLMQFGSYFHFAFKNGSMISYVQSSIRQNTQFSEFLLISGSIVAIGRQCAPVPRGTAAMPACLVFACFADPLPT
jgi:hypothetical protein